jgi:integrase
MAPEQLTEILKAFEDDPYEPMVIVAVSTGLRSGELRGLRWSDVDLEERCLKTVQQIQPVEGRLQVTALKTQQSRRTLFLPPVAVAALVAHRARQNRQKLKKGDKWVDTGLVFTTNRGTAIDGSNFTHRFQRVLESNGVQRIRPHDLRHATATFLLDLGYSMVEVKEQLGHSQIHLTVNTYGHVQLGRKKQAADDLGRVIRGGAVG